ncbi:MAG: hypothetical protein EOO71_38970, partial [Myxococcaceae bacterium]
KFKFVLVLLLGKGKLLLLGLTKASTVFSMLLAACAMAPNPFHPVTSAATIAATAAALPQMGPANPTRASSRPSTGDCFRRTNAPSPGMNMGALACMPKFRSAATCPISCT